MSASRRTAEQTVFAADTAFVRLRGFGRVDDGGGGLFRRAVRRPDQPGRLQSADGAWWELKPENGRISILQFGAAPNGTADSAPAIKACHEAAVALAAIVHVPAATFNLIPATPFQGEESSYLNTACFPILSGLNIVADEGATYRIADRQSSDAAPKPLSMFATNGPRSDFSVRGLTMDMNGRNNRISPRRRDGVYNLYNIAQIMVSGSENGVAARVDNVALSDCRFLNSPGVSCIVMMQSNRPGVRISRNWVVQRCEFRNNGLDAADHSSIFAWADDVSVINNQFENDQQYGPQGPGGNVAYEVHGARQSFSGNRITRYFQGVWISGNYTTPATGVVVSDNVMMAIKARGVEWFGQVGSMQPVPGAVVEDNEIELDDTPHPGVALKYGVLIASPSGQDGATVRRNRVTAAGSTVATAMMGLSAPHHRGEMHDNILVEGNTAEHLTFGEFIKTNPECGLGRVIIRNNRRIDLTPGGSFPAAIGLSVSYDGAPSPIDHLTMDGNQTIDDRRPPRTAFATRIEGKVSTLERRAETLRGLGPGQAYVEAAARVGRRIGVFPDVLQAP